MPSPPPQVRVVALPAVTEVGRVVNAILAVCAAVATMKVALMRSALEKYIVIDL